MPTKIVFKHNNYCEFTKPKRLGDTEFFTQTIWDKSKKTGYIAVLSLEEVLEQARQNIVYVPRKNK